jgi:hypothetical protein
MVLSLEEPPCIDTKRQTKEGKKGKERKTTEATTVIKHTCESRVKM